MREQDRIDLAELDPMREPDRWSSIVDETLQRVDGVLAARSRDPLSLIASWSRPLTWTGCLMIGLLIPVEIMLEKREKGEEQIEHLVRLSTQTAFGEELPTGAELSRALDNRLP